MLRFALCWGMFLQVCAKSMSENNQEKKSEYWAKYLLSELFGDISALAGYTAVEKFAQPQFEWLKTQVDKRAGAWFEKRGAVIGETKKFPEAALFGGDEEARAEAIAAYAQEYRAEQVHNAARQVVTSISGGLGNIAKQRHYDHHQHKLDNNYIPKSLTAQLLGKGGSIVITNLSIGAIRNTTPELLEDVEKHSAALVLKLIPGLSEAQREAMMPKARDIAGFVLDTLYVDFPGAAVNQTLQDLFTRARKKGPPQTVAFG